MGAADARPELADRDDLRGARAVASLQRRLERLPDNHPASPRYVRDAHGPAEPDRPDAADGSAETEVRPLTDAEHADHVADVRVRLEKARAAGLSTDVQHTIDDEREIWSDEREALHDALLDDLYGQAASVPNELKAVIAGGIAGAGKTTVLTKHARIDLGCYLMINPDLIKEEMARRGLIPEVAGLTPMEASELVHEESSHIAKRLAHRAHTDGKNVIWDVTMSKLSSTEERIDWLIDAGYRRIDGVFVHISSEVSARRVDGRHRDGHEDHRAGVGYGGRWLPGEMAMAQQDAQWGTRNRAVFERVKHRFDSWSIYDNSVDGRAPVLVETHGAGDQAKELLA
jgi:predicted ABC-type ATPase